MNDERRELEFNNVLLMLNLRQKAGERLDLQGLKLASLHQIAEIVGDISVSTLSRIDRNHTPDMTTFMCLCEVFELSPADYFLWTVWVRKDVTR